MPTTNNSVLALDVGSRRVGVAIGSFAARLPQPLTTLINDENLVSELKRIIDTESVTDLVIGLPRGLQGQDTEQTIEIATFAKQLKQELNLTVHFQDEAVTSKQAESELQARGKTYDKSDIDALAATYILEDWFVGHKDIA